LASLIIVLASALLKAAPFSARDGGALKLFEVRESDGVQVWGENSDRDAVRWVWIELAAAQNVQPEGGLPRGFVLRPLDRRLLFTLRPQDPGRGYSYALRSRGDIGDPEREPDPKAVYLLPWEHGRKHTVTQGYFGSATHQGLYALDFDLDNDTPVCAARDGVVVRVKVDGDTGGPSKTYAEDGNSITVLHDDATWAVYAHLRYQGSRVQPGQRVKAGELIGYSGATGLASGPHLHLAVYRATWEGPRSIPTVFLVGLSVTASLEEGRTYYSRHPGKPDFEEVLGERLRDEDFRGLTRTARGGRLSLREQRVDRRNLIWAANGTERDLLVSVDLDRAQGVRPNAPLPWRGVVPAGTEIFLFSVDFVGGAASSYRLKAQYQNASSR
jgi:murein DD-endopeptidase MepM/ murein hydrolase activator NlpD